MMRSSRSSSIAVAVALGAIFTLSSGASAQGWFDAAWGYRTKVTIASAQVPADQTDVPVLFLLSGIDTAHGFWTNAKVSGDDLVVTTSDGTTRLPLEVVSCDTTAKTGEIWFKGTLSSTVNTDFYLYYGNAGAAQPAAGDTYGSQNVWSNGYAGVWHLDETTGTHVDSTANGNDATVASGSSVTQDAAGKIGGADAFDDASDSLRADDDVSLDITATLTLEAWIYPNATGDYQMRLISKRAVDVNECSYAMFFRNTSSAINDIGFRARDGAGSVTIDSDGTVPLDQWSHVAVTYNDAADAVQFYINGSLDTTNSPFTKQIAATDLQLDIGGVENRPGRTFIGTIDEARISSVVRDADYVQMQYNMTNDQSAFWPTIGAEETSSGGPVLTTIEVSPATAAILPNESQAFTAAAKDQSGNPMSVVISWQVSGGGSVAPATGDSTTFTSTGSEGTFIVTASSGGVDGTAQVTVSSGLVLTSIEVTPSVANIQPGETQAFAAEALDQYGDPMVPQPAISWLVSGGGSVSPGTGASTTFTSDGTEDTFTITASSGGVDGTATLTVAPLVVTTINVTPATANIQPSGIQAFTAEALDQNGTPIVVNVAWSIDVPAGGTLSPTSGTTDAVTGKTTTTFTSSGPESTYTVTASSGGVQDTATITVSQLTVTTITVNPGSPEIEPGKSASFTALARDQNGDPIITPISWVLSGGGTLSNDTGSATTFTSSGEEGTFTLTASSVGVEGKAKIVVMPLLTGVGAGEGCHVCRGTGVEPLAGAAAWALFGLWCLTSLAASVRRRRT